MSAATIAYAVLSGHAPLTALVGARIYPLVIPESAQLPAVVYSVQSEREARRLAAPAAISGALTFAQVRITAAVAPNDYVTLQQIMAAIRGALPQAVPFDAGGSHNVVVHSGAEGEDTFDADAQIAMRSRTVQITFNQPT